MSFTVCFGHRQVVRSFFQGRVIGVGGRRRRRWIVRLTSAHESVTGAGVNDRVESFVQLLHGVDGWRYGGVDAHVILCIESVNRCANLCQRSLIDSERLSLCIIARRRTIKDERRFQARSARGEKERSATSPAEA